MSLRSGDWDPSHWTASIGCASGSLALAPAGGWTTSLLPVSYCGLWGRSLGRWTPVSSLKMSLWLCFVLRLLGRSANSSLLGSWLSSVWVSHAFGRSSFPLCLLNVGFSLSINTSTYMQTRESGEGARVKHWSSVQSFVGIKYVTEHQDCRDQYYMSAIFEEFRNLVGDHMVQLIHVTHRGKCCNKGPSSMLPGAQEERQQNHGNSGSLYGGCDKNHFDIFKLCTMLSVHLAMLNKIIADNSLAIL